MENGFRWLRIRGYHNHGSIQSIWHNKPRIVISKVTCIRSYLENRWHRTKINTSFSTWEELLHGVHQGSVLGPLLFIIYFNDLFYFFDNTDASNYADDTDLYACDTDLVDPVRRLEHDALIAIEWFDSNYMKLNVSKCHFLISVNKSEHLFENVGPHKIWESSVVKILGVRVDASLKFNVHGRSIVKKAGKKLTILARMSKILGFQQMKLLIKSFFESRFAYCPLVWMLYNRSLNNKNYMSGLSEFYTNKDDWLFYLWTTAS